MLYCSQVLMICLLYLCNFSYFNYSKLLGFIQETIEEHFKTYDEQHLRDYIDVFLKEIKENNGKESTFTS